MKVLLTPEDKVTLELWARARSGGARRAGFVDRRSLEENDPLLMDYHGVVGEFAVWRAFDLGPDELARIREKSGDDGGIDLVCPSGHTIDVKCPMTPGYPFLIASMDARKFRADFGVVVDFLPRWDHAIVWGWTPREEILNFPRRFGPPQYRMRESLGVHRDNLNRLHAHLDENLELARCCFEVPLWVRTRTVVRNGVRVPAA